MQIHITRSLEKQTYPYNWQNKVILVVEDDLPNFKYFEYLLKEVKASILWESNGRDAIRRCSNAREKIDLVIMDFLIPFVNGIEATRQIRRQRKGLPIIMVSAYDTFDSREKCFLAGCNEFLSKPILPRKLLETIALYLEPVADVKTGKEVPVEQSKLFRS